MINDQFTMTNNTKTQMTKNKFEHQFYVKIQDRRLDPGSGPGDSIELCH